LIYYLEKSGETANIYCIGDEALLKPLLAEHRLTTPNIITIHASQVIGMHEHPTKALKEKTHSSIAVGFHLLSTDKIDAFMSAGNTGAMLVGSVYATKPIPGILRPTISTVIPKLSGGTGLLLDVGLNADCKPENLNQFAVLGSVYAENILGISNPGVGLLNVGEEEGKGNMLAQAAYPLLKNNHRINFVGNIEGRDILFEKADVIVCEGFTGNVILKLAESMYDIAIARNMQDDGYYKRFNYEAVGGTPVLGILKPVIIGHGISNAEAFCNMMLLAEKMISSHICEKMADQFKN
jgi:glycerol-3-phosphate acyltransferase PlsX